MKKMQKGFSLVELMVVIAIIAILAAVAIPMYSNYTSRAQIGTALASIGGIKSDIAETAMTKGTLTGVGSGSTSLNGVALPTASGSSLKYTSTVTDGVINLSLTAPVTGNITMTPTMGSSSMTWACASTNIPSSKLPSPCSGT
ncbi:pilin [Pseudofrancisella aestuarii]|uniref:Pilin n=1 Tax=Pseudofrancisella aestuarii TaxID=2670347 RepID=A0ABV9TE32_9GAMM